jgi:hypothetical protein
MVKTPKELLREELVCFMTKSNIRESTLGIGITIKRSPRTGLCMYVNPTMDLMSMRAFTKLKVRKSISGERFSHWLPLFFGEKEKYDIVTKNYDHETGEMVETIQKVDVYERFEKHINQTMSFCTIGSTRRPFTGEQAFRFMIKLIGTHIVDMMKENKHMSIVAIRRLFNFIRLLQYFIQKYPEIQEQIEDSLNAFMNDPDTRHKKICKNLLDYQILAIMSKKVIYQEFVKHYCDEQLDR